MEASTVLAIVIPLLVVAAGGLFATAARRRDVSDALGTLSRETLQRDRGPVVTDLESAPSGREVEAAARVARTTTLVRDERAAPAPYIPPDPEQLGVTRRQFLNRSIIASFGLGLSGFGAAVLAFLWPSLSGGFGSKINAGSIADILDDVANSKEPAYFPEGRFYVAPYPTEAVSAAEAVYSSGVLDGMKSGVVALYQKCPHLGCRVPWCKTSQWFECPCHGSQYNRVGEKKGGPAPRGMDLFPVSVNDDGTMTVDTGTVVLGSAIGVNTTGQEAEGPHCISGGH